MNCIKCLGPVEPAEGQLKAVADSEARVEQEAATATDKILNQDGIRHDLHVRAVIAQRDIYIAYARRRERDCTECGRESLIKQRNNSFLWGKREGIQVAINYLEQIRPKLIGQANGSCNEILSKLYRLVNTE